MCQLENKLNFVQSLNRWGKWQEKNILSEKSAVSDSFNFVGD